MENFVQTEIESELLFHDGDKHVNGDRHPDLSFHGVLRGTEKGFDAEVLLDPPEEQFDLPTGSIELCDGQGREKKIVGEENEAPAVVGIEVVDAPQGTGIKLSRFRSGQQNGLVGPESGGLVDRMGASPTELGILLGAGDEESEGLSELVETLEVYVAAIEQIKSARFQKQPVEEIDVVHLRSGHINIGRNAAAQIQQGVNLDRTFVPAKLSPGKKGQAQIDGGGIEGVNGLVQVHGEGVVTIELARLSDEPLREIGIDAPVAMLVGVGERGARNPTAESHMIELGLLRPQTRFDVAQTFAISELSESEAEKLIPARKIFDVAMTLIAIDRELKLVGGDELHELRENRLPRVHRLPPKQDGKQSDGAPEEPEN